MIWPPLADESAVTALPLPVSKTFCHVHGSLVLGPQVDFQPAVETHTSCPPMTQVFASCWSCISGVTNRVEASQPLRPLRPNRNSDSHAGLTKFANVCPPSVVRYIAPSTYSPAKLLPFCGSTITSKPSPPAGSTIWELPVAM